jgi:hypothetical protein
VIVTYSGVLSPDQLAKLLKALADHTYRYPQTTDVSELLHEATSEQGVIVSIEQCAQIYEALYTAMPAGTVRSGDHLAAVQSYVTVSLVEDPRALYDLLMSAWKQAVTEANEQPFVPMLVEEQDGLLVPDPRDKDLQGLGIAEMFFLAAHDRFDGRPLLAEPVVECGVAGALLADLMCRGLIALDLASHQVHPTAVSGVVAGISAPTRQALEEIQDGEPAALGSWLTALSINGYRAVRRHLTKELRIVDREERGRLQKRTCFRPVDPEIVESVFRVATRPLAVKLRPPPPFALLIELARATRLNARRPGAWAYLHGLAPGGALSEIPDREPFDLLLALARAEVTERLSRP